MSTLTSHELKEQGNRLFQAGDFKAAEGFYTKAILKNPTNPILFTNRAINFIRLSIPSRALNDSLKAIELDPTSMKGYYYLAQSQLALSHPNEAVSSALTAYNLCLAAPAKYAASLTAQVCELVLRAKKEKWERRDRERIRMRVPFLAELEEGLQASYKWRVDALGARHAKGEVGRVQMAEEQAALGQELEAKVGELRTVFALADPENCSRREVPDWMIDHISFGVMHDPVMTKNGHSYERSNIERVIKTSGEDPLTRELLKVEDLRPNIGLREACAEFLDANGWAVDW